MSSTTVRYKDAEFVANDTFIELWLLEVVRLIDQETPIEPWLKELRDEWHLQGTSGFGFGVCPALERFVTDDARRDTLVWLFQKALEAVGNRGTSISVEELQRSGAGGPGTFYTQELPTTAVIEVGQNFLNLLSAPPAKPPNHLPT